MNSAKQMDTLEWNGATETIPEPSGQTGIISTTVTISGRTQALKNLSLSNKETWKGKCIYIISHALNQERSSGH